MMAHIKQYRVVGVGYNDVPYEIVRDFFRSQGGSVHSNSFIEDVGFPQNIAQSMVNRWNSVVDMYRRSDPEYRGPTYSLVMPESMPVGPVSVADSNESEEAAFELVKYGQWTLTDFQAWMAKMVGQSYDAGRKNVISGIQLTIEKSGI
jgi:hypothetical protein